MIGISSVERKHHRATTGGCELLGSLTICEPVTCSTWSLISFVFLKICVGYACFSIPKVWDETETVIRRDDQKTHKHCVQPIITCLKLRLIPYILLFDCFSTNPCISLRRILLSQIHTSLASLVSGVMSIDLLRQRERWKAHWAHIR